MSSLCAQFSPSGVSSAARGVFRSVTDLQAAINRFLYDHNARSKPFQCVADPDKIIGAVRPRRQALESIQ